MTKRRLRIIMGENIRNERSARNISMDELSEMLGLTPGFVGLIERGQRGATPTTLLKLSNIFGMPIDRFFYSDEGVQTLKLGDNEGKRDDRRKKIDALMSDFTISQLDFIIAIIQNVRLLFSQKAKNDDEDFYNDEE